MPGRVLGRLVDPDWVAAKTVRPGSPRTKMLRVLFYPDGSVRFEHLCDRPGRGIIVCAPLLNEGHQLVSQNPLTITPSILCPDCGTHGFVTNGKWVPA